jgi:hypothetical protein
MQHYLTAFTADACGTISVATGSGRGSARKAGEMDGAAVDVDGGIVDEFGAGAMSEAWAADYRVGLGRLMNEPCRD